MIQRERLMKNSMTYYQMYLTVREGRDILSVSNRMIQKEVVEMARETQKEKIVRLETELTQAIAQRDAAIADALALNSKLNAKNDDVRNSPVYQSLLRECEQWKRSAKTKQDHIERENKRYSELVAMYEDLERQLKNLMDRQVPGRKRAYTDRTDQIMKLRDKGMSVRKISAELDIPSATVARYIKNVSK